MNAHSTTSEEFFSACYLHYKGIIKNYIFSRIPHSYEAEDLIQDVFVRLWEHKEFLNRDTVRSLLFTIAHNMIIDRIRRHYKKEEFISYIYNVQEVSRNMTDDSILYRELKVLHEGVVVSLPSKRKKIYQMSFYNEMSCVVIADKLSLSVRTVEGQLLLARKAIRTSLSKSIDHVG